MTQTEFWVKMVLILAVQVRFLFASRSYLRDRLYISEKVKTLQRKINQGKIYDRVNGADQNGTFRIPAGYKIKYISPGKYVDHCGRPLLLTPTNGAV